MRTFLFQALLVLLCHALRAATIAASTETAIPPETIEGLRVVHLTGAPYELGVQHGRALREDVRDSVAQVLGYFRRYLKVPLVRTWLVNGWIDRVWRAEQPFVSKAYLEELRGLADGSGVALRELYRLHAIPDRTYSCASFAAWGTSTAHGRLIHVRNLDWNIEAGIQRYAAVFVVRPQGKHAFVNVGWAGFIGVLTGINDAQISIGQIGAETTDARFHGEPMAFLMRRVMETASTLDEASSHIQSARRTVGVNYIIADAKIPGAVALETTARHARTFAADDALEHTVPYARPLADAVFRADTAMDQTIRDRQLASGGNPVHPGLEDPAGSSAYEIRYLGQAAGLQAHAGQLDGHKAQEIAHAIAPSSNVQSVIMAWPDLWVANAQDFIRAAHTPYHHLNLEALLKNEGKPQ